MRRFEIFAVKLFKGVYGYATCVGAGLLLGIALATEHGWPLFMLALPLFFALLEYARSYTRAFLIGWLFGTVKSAIALWWFWDTLPLDWLGMTLPYQIIAIGFSWSTSALMLGLGFAAFGALWYWFRGRLQILFIFMPFAWILAEIVGSAIFSVYTLGPGSYINSHFSLGYLGYVFAEHSLIAYVAQFGGVYILSFLAALIGGGVFAYIQYAAHFEPTHRVLGIVLGACVLVITANISLPNDLTSGERFVIAIDTNFTTYDLELTPNGYANRHAELREAIQKALTYEPDVILLPEDSRFTTGFQTMYEAKNVFAQMSAGTDTILIDSARYRDTRGETVLRAFVYDQHLEMPLQFDKQYLLPMGEYTVYVMSALGRMAGAGNMLLEYEAARSYRPGVMHDSSRIPNRIPGVLFCSESISPVRTKQVSEIRPMPFIVHPISHAWFNNTTTLPIQLHRMLVVSALWSGEPIVVAGNVSKGKLYLPNGTTNAGVTLVETEAWRLQKYTF